MDHFYPKLLEASFELAHELPVFQLVLDCLIMHRGLVRGMPVQIYALRDPILLDIALETVHGRDGPLVLVEPRKNLSRGIVDISHEYTDRTSSLEPIMMGAVQ